MRIEIAKEDRMTMKGSALKRILQNESMPLLDLFIRESIQNSLDAANNSENYVQISMGTNSFMSKDLSPHFEGIEDELDNKFGDSECKYLYIGDKNTKGLTGPMHFSQASNNEYGNLLKLVYDIGNPQEKLGAGGSWGYGKTIYYRMGIGLVIYYSRIINEDGNYESRLSACLVENEKREDALLKSTNSKRGIAWWGAPFTYYHDEINEQVTVPITDEKKIEEILDIFNIPVYSGIDTGTIVVIPYINEYDLLYSNIDHEEGENTYLPYWINNIDSYLNVSIQRWYFGRIENPIYFKKYEQPFLRIALNNKIIDSEHLEPTFKAFRELYDCCLRGKEYKTKTEPWLEEIKIKNTFKSTTAGWVSYMRADKEILKMNPPSNCYNPIAYIKNKELLEINGKNNVILSFFRRPGMVVSYEMSGDWVKQILNIDLDEEEYLFIVFVLNSSNEFYPPNSQYSTIEEYFRASENADHTAWHDKSIENKMPNILTRIQKNIANKIRSSYQKDDTSTVKVNSSLGKIIGDVFLPPEGFGVKPSGKRKVKKVSETTITKKKNIAIRTNNGLIKFFEDKMTISMHISSRNGFKYLGFNTEIVTDGNSNITLEEWVNVLHLPMPFEIDNIKITMDEYDGEKVDETILITKLGKSTYKDWTFTPIMCNDSYFCGLSMVSYEKHSMNCIFEVTVKINNNEAKFGYTFKDEMN